MTNTFLSKDNFWNLMFWVGMVASITLSSIFDVSWIFWVTLIITGYVTKNAQNISLNAEEIFVNGEGQLLNDRYPVLTQEFLSLTLFLVIYGAFRGMLHDSIFVGLKFGILLLPFVLYFVKLDCPISILFLPKAWSEEVIGWKIDNTPRQHNPVQDRIRRHRTSPVYSYLPGNIWHNKHR